MVLLVAMVGAIVLTLRHRVGVKRQSIAAQVARGPATAIEVRKVETGKGLSMTIGLSHYLTVAAILFTIGIFGIFINRKNVIVILMSVELILLAVNINLVAFSAFLGDLVGQVFALVRADRRRRRGRHRPCHPRRLLPQSRFDRGRRHQHDEGLSLGMYSAIVFLPLLGAIIAGLIAVFGAYRTVSLAEATAEHGGHGAHSHAHDAEEEGDSDDAHGHDHHEPAALGSRPAEIITSGFLVVAAILSWIAFFSVGFGEDAVQRIEVLNWFPSGTHGRSTGPSASTR